MTSLPFHKMHALGNDFMVINGLKHPLPNKEQIRALANRHTGIGFDQLLYLSESKISGADFQYRIFNADGNEVEQCGNGVRCIATFIRKQKLSSKDTLTLHCLAGIITTEFVKNQVKVNLGSLKNLPKPRTFTFPDNKKSYEILYIDLGNPHAVLPVSDIHTFNLESLGTWCNQSSSFPQGVNLEITQSLNEKEIAIRVFERGVGETQACGTGACAAAIAAIFMKKQTSPLTVHLPGGKLFIEWDGNLHSPVYMTGPAHCVFSGEIALTPNSK